MPPRTEPARLLRALPASAVLLALAGCVVSPSPARIAALNATIGETETALIQQAGVPNRTIETGGHRFLAYVEQRVDVIPGSPGFYGGWGWGGPYGWGGFGGFPPEVVTRGCETTFEITDGRVARWSLRGDAC